MLGYAIYFAHVTCVLVRYRISSNFQYLEIFVMKKFDSGNFQKGLPLANVLRPKICVYENYLWKNAGMNKSTVLPRIHTRMLPVFFLNAMEPVLK